MRSLLFQTWVLEWIRILDWTIRSVQWSNPAFFRQWTKLKIFSQRSILEQWSMLLLQVGWMIVILCMLVLVSPPCLVFSCCKMLLHGFELELGRVSTLLLFYPHWLTACPLSTFQFQFLLSVFKSLNGLVPAHLSELLHLHSPSQSLRSADQLLLDVLRTRWRLRGIRVFAAVALFFSKVLYK